MKTDYQEKTLAEVQSEKKPTQPPLYQVIMCNDDFTPMDFVVALLRDIFNMDELRAQNVMLEIHNLGQALCGVYIREVSEMKVSQVLSLAHTHEYPLRCYFEHAI